MEERVIVLSTPLWKRAEKVILAMPEAKKIKQVKSNGFFWIANDKAPEENVAEIKKAIKASPGGSAMVFQVYPIVNGKIDMDKSSMTREQKKQTAYFMDPKKDITEDELKAFAAANNL